MAFDYGPTVTTLVGGFTTIKVLESGTKMFGKTSKLSIGSKKKGKNKWF